MAGLGSPPISLSRRCSSSSAAGVVVSRSRLEARGHCCHAGADPVAEAGTTLEADGGTP
jgi:hypothetical protein